MKRITLFLMITTLLITSVSIRAYAEESTITVIVDGRVIEFSDALAYVDENGRTQVPSRFIGEALGAYVEWNPDLQGVSFTRRSALFDEGSPANVYFRINGKYFYVRSGTHGSHETRSMDTEAVIVKGQSYIPIRFLAETLGATVDWEDNLGQITITINSKTKTVGDFVIPQSFTGAVIYGGNYSNGIKGTMFTVSINDMKMMSDFTNRIDHFYDIASQKIDVTIINNLKTFIGNNLDVRPESSQNAKAETFLDQVSGRYVSICRTWDNSFIIRVYDKGISPVEYLPVDDLEVYKG